MLNYSIKKQCNNITQKYLNRYTKRNLNNHASVAIDSF